MNFYTFNSRRFAFLTILAGVLPFLCFAAASEWLMRRVILRADANNFHIRCLNHASASSVVVGDSHAANALWNFPGFINLSYPGESYRHLEEKLYYYAKGKKLLRAVVQADPHMFSPDRERQAATYSATYLNEIADRSWLQILSPKHRGFILHYWRMWWRGEKFHSEYTFEPDCSLTLDEDFTRRSVSADQVRGTVPVEQYATGAAAAAFTRIVDFLRREGAEICLLSLPVSPEFSALSAQYPRYEAARKFLEDFAKARGIRYVNFYSGVALDQKDFANIDHLNRRGAAIWAPKVHEACFGER